MSLGSMAFISVYRHSGACRWLFPMHKTCHWDKYSVVIVIVIKPHITWEVIPVIHCFLLYQVRIRVNTDIYPVSKHFHRNQAKHSTGSMFKVLSDSTCVARVYIVLHVLVNSLMNHCSDLLKYNSENAIFMLDLHCSIIPLSLVNTNQWFLDVNYTWISIRYLNV